MVSSSIEALQKIDEANKELRERNAQRLAEAKQAMGRKYLLHPENAMSREKYSAISKVTA